MFHVVPMTYMVKRVPACATNYWWRLVRRRCQTRVQCTLRNSALFCRMRNIV